MQELHRPGALGILGSNELYSRMPAQEIALLGNPVLRRKCVPVSDIHATQTRECIENLRDTLAEFRASHGFGRGIAAPQIGSPKQIIYTNAEYQGALINPRIVQRSKKTFMLWDDCFSFPDILVKVERHYSIAVSYQDETGTKRQLKASGAMAELLQHEIDHVQGILAIDRAIDSRHIILRSEFNKLSRRRLLAL